MGPLIVQIVVVLLILFSFFVLYMCFKTWNIFHVIASFFVFAAGIAFVVLASLVLKTHQEWRQYYNKSLADLTVEQAREKRLLEGDSAGATPEDRRSLLSLKSELKQVLADRGRVWPECTPRADPSGVIVNVVPASATAPPWESHQIAPNMILYAFKDVVLFEGRERLPAIYLGEFKVTAAPDKAAEVTLTPTYPLDAIQLAQANQPGTWTLFEIMPVDSHHIFAEDDFVDNVDGKTAMFGKMMPAEEIKKYMPNLPEYGIPPERYEQIVQSYARDGQKALDADAAEETWMKVKFLKEHKMAVDGEATASPFDNDHFDLTGGAIRAELRSEAEGGATFAAGDYGFFPRDLEPDPASGRYTDGSAEQLASDGLVERDQAEPLIYVRPLNDYEHMYHEIARRSDRVDLDKALVDAQAQVVRDSSVRTQTQIDVRQAEYTKLDADRTGFREEAAQMTAYREKLAAEEVALKKSLSGLYRTNLALADELTSLQAEMAADIDRRTGAMAGR